MLSIMTLLAFVDLIMLYYTVGQTLSQGVSVLVIFAFESFLLLSNLLATFVKYVLHIVDMRAEESWEEKSIYFLYTDLGVDLMKLIAYTAFFVVIVSSYGLPLHIIRDLYITSRSFLQKCNDLMRYRRATANMEERYLTPTQVELDETDRVCIVCREEMTLDMPQDNSNRLNLPKKLPCGHLFHFRCLRAWLERQQTCPTWYFKFHDY
jgi:E3 ubiquitin-protein ligase synoviolin